MKNIGIYVITLCSIYPICLYGLLQKKNEPAPTLSETITLSQAISFAQQHRSSLHELLFASKAERNNAYAALSDYLPQITFNSRFLAAKDRALPKNQQYITIDQLLFSFAGPVENYRIASLSARIKDLQARYHYDEIRNQIENTFFKLYLQQARISPINSGETAAIALLEKTHASNEQGLLNSYDFETEKAQYAYAMDAIFGYEQQTFIAKTNLTKALEAPNPFIINMLNARHEVKSTIATIANLPYDEAFFKSAAHQLRKDLALKDEEISLHKQLKELKEKSYLPSASLYANISTGQPALAVGLRQLPGNFWQAGIQFSWNFDGLGNAHKAAEEEALLQEALCAKRAKELTIDQEVSNAYHELLQAHKNLVANTNDQSPEELFLQQKKRYELGDLSETEYKKAVYEWEKAQFAIRELEVKTVLKYKELLFKSGYPDSNNPSSMQRNYYDKNTLLS